MENNTMTAQEASAIINDPRVSSTLEQMNQAVAVELVGRYPTLEDYGSAHPVCQNFHTGKWGYERVLDCLNLDACRFRTLKAAKTARNEFYRQSVSSALSN